MQRMPSPVQEKAAAAKRKSSGAAGRSAKVPALLWIGRAWLIGIGVVAPVSTMLWAPRAVGTARSLLLHLFVATDGPPH